MNRCQSITCQRRAPRGKLCTACIAKLSGVEREHLTRGGWRCVMDIRAIQRNALGACGV